jgi:hypothetical protein
MLRFAHLPDAADPAILIWGDATALDRLAALLREAARNGRGRTLVDPSHSPAVSLEITVRGGGMTHVSGSQFRWSLRRADCDRFAGLVDVVSTSDTPCHHYLDDTEGRGLTTKVSKGEYPDDFRP